MFSRGARSGGKWAGGGGGVMEARGYFALEAELSVFALGGVLAT